jgi:hypothetical protein
MRSRGLTAGKHSQRHSALQRGAGSLTPHLGRHILARLMDCHAIVSECRQQTPHGRMRAETASERVRALLLSMALIWTKLAEEAEPIQRIH